MTVLWLVVGLVVGLAAGGGGTVAVSRSRRGAAEDRARRIERDAEGRVERAERRAEEAEAEVTTTRTASDGQRRRADDAIQRAAAAAADAARAESRAVAAESALAAAPLGALDTAWALTGLRVAWSQRAIDPSAPPVERIDLVAGAGAEVERIREEIGTPGTLRADQVGDLPPAAALVGLLGLEEVLAALVHRTDAYDLVLGVDAGHLVAEVACEGDAAVSPTDPDLAALAAALGPAGADLATWRRDDGVLVSRLRVPLR